MYGPKHVRVRAVQARIDELQKELNKLGELDDSSSENNSPLYPSIRKLPLLALDYTELYRQAKIQEALYESLMKQYEVAKVEEAEEIPTVRVLDSPTYPERRVSPPRKLLILCGALLGLALGSAVVIGRVAWKQADFTSGRKALVVETWSALRSDAVAISQTVSRRRTP
jgi:capsule polysaccharide export protein KpsE/RkpR